MTKRLPSADLERKEHTWSPAVRLGACTIALDTSVAEASQQTGVPESTIYQWFSDAGGIGEIRSVANAREFMAGHASKTAIHNAVEAKAKAGELPPKELSEVYREIVKPPPATSAPSTAPALAAATIRVELPGPGGTVEVVDVPRTRPPALAEPQTPPGTVSDVPEAPPASP